MSHLHPASRAAVLFAVVTLCAVVALPQTAQERPQPAPTGLALEVNTKVGPIGHETVPGNSFGGRYRRLPSWSPPPGERQPRTFSLANAPEGDAVRVKVFALMDRFHEERVLLGDYLLREGEKAVVEAMRRYGYEPMELTVVRVRPVLSLVPAAESRVASVGVVGVKEKQANFPSYAVTLVNLSHKDITFLEIKTPSSVQWPRGEQNRPLIKAGETWDAVVRGDGRGQSSSEGFTPSAPERVEIVTAVFADESYEGDPLSAARHVAMLRGQKMQLARALALWGTEGGAARPTFEEFERGVNALGREAPTPPEGLPKTHGVTGAGLDSLRASVEGGLDLVRREMLKDIREYRQARERAADAPAYDAWLGDLRKKYEAWLSRL